MLELSDCVGVNGGRMCGFPSHESFWVWILYIVCESRDVGRELCRLLGVGLGVEFDFDCFGVVGLLLCWLL